VQVADAPVGRPAHLLDVPLDPVVVVERALVLGRDDDRLAGALERRAVVHAERHLVVCLPRERLPDVGQLRGGPAVHGDDEVALLDVHADVGERRPKRRVPVLALQDPGDPEELRLRVALEPRAEQAHRDPRRPRHVAAAHVSVTGVQLPDQLADDVRQVRAVVHVLEQRRILHLHRRPVHAVHVRGVEEVAHLPPRLVEHLPPLGPAVHRDLQVREIQEVLQLGPVGGRVDDRVSAGGGHQHLLAVRRDLVPGAAGHHLRLGSLVEVEHVERGRLARAGTAVIEPVADRDQRTVVGRGDG